jgi:transglutaminase superfamily protein
VSPLNVLRRHLAAHVYACETADYVVLLDMQRHRYLGVSRDDLHALLESIAANPAETDAGQELMRTMSALGMLAVAPASSSARPTELATRSLYEGFVPFDIRLDIRTSIDVLLALAEAKVALWNGNLERYLDKNRNRAVSQNTDLSRLRGLVASYLHCRAWLFTAAGECLLDSLTLHGFMSRYGIATSMVIGVRTSPFGAHAWVQSGDYILNDELETVSAYERIFASA